MSLFRLLSPCPILSGTTRLSTPFLDLVGIDILFIVKVEVVTNLDSSEDSALSELLDQIRRDRSPAAVPAQDFGSLPRCISFGVLIAAYALCFPCADPALDFARDCANCCFSASIAAVCPMRAA